MIYKRGQTYWYKFVWSIRQRDGTSKSYPGDRAAYKRRLRTIHGLSDEEAGSHLALTPKHLIRDL